MKLNLQTTFLNRIFINDSLNEVDENLTDPDTIKNELIKNYKNEGYNDVKVKLATLRINRRINTLYFHNRFRHTIFSL